MNISLRKRIAGSYILASITVLVIGISSFYFLNSLNNKIENITTNTNKVSLLSDEVRISAVTILKLQKKIVVGNANKEDLERLSSLTETFYSQLQRLGAFYNEVEEKTIISKMFGYVESLKTLLSKISLSKTKDNAGVAAVGELADKILESFSEFQDIQYFQNEKRDMAIKDIIHETKRYMLLTLIVTFFVTIILSLVVPSKIALPFKKINDAVRELQECNFDVSIFYNQNDEIGELSRELNKMIFSMKQFEELRADKISVEHRKFDILANMVKKNILITNVEGELIYLNNKMYKILNLESSDVLYKKMNDARIPASIKDTFELALKRRSKIENAEIIITQKKKTQEETPSSEDQEGEREVEVFEEVFNGYANVIPIRAKESSLDYYMMVLSTEVFV